MTTKLQRLRKRQRFNRHVEQLKNKKAKAEAHRAREKRERRSKRTKRQQKRLSGLKRLRNGYAVERRKEAKAFKNTAPHPFRYEERKARAALDKTAARDRPTWPG